MGKKKKRGAEDESSSSSSSSSSSDDIFTEETAYRKRRSEARRINRKKEGKVIGILIELKEEMCKQSKKFSESKDDTSEIRKLLEKLTENHNDQSKRLEKLTESYNDLRKQLELHTNKGTSGDDSAASRSQSHHVQQPRYRLEFTSGVIDKIEKGQSIEISVALVDCNNNQTVENGPLASATVELVVVNSEFNQHDNQYNWSREEFERNVKKARQANSATEDVDQSVKSIVSNGRFNLIHGVKCHSGSKIFSNSSNKKVRLGVMVVSPTEERVLEGLSNPFFVRGHDRPNRQCRLPDSRSNRQGLHNGYQEQNGPMPYMQNPSWANSVQAIDEPLESDYFMGMNAVESNLFRTPGNIGHELSSALVGIGRGQNFIGDDHAPVQAIGPAFNTNQTAFPVHLIWDWPNLEPRKRHWNLLDQLMPLYSCQQKLNDFILPTMHLTSQKTRRRGGVLIEPLEANDSDAERPLKRRLHCKYRLQFVNKVCEAYYTMDPIKTDDGNLIKVALFDESNTKITYGPMSSASVEVVVLHGDFNVDGQDYWTSEEFKRCVISPQPGNAESVVGGDSILVLSDGEACLGYAFFQVTSFLARTGKFKMGVMLTSTQDERIQEGISEPFFVNARHVGGLPLGFRFYPTDEELILHYLRQRTAAAPLPVPIMADVDIYMFDPWDLPAKAVFGDHELYFFRPRDRKYPNDSRPKYAAGSGYWKTTGIDKAIVSTATCEIIGVKKALVFYKSRPPTGVKTDWIMHEYRLIETDEEKNTMSKGSSMRLQDWVLCRIYRKAAAQPVSLLPSIVDEGPRQQPPPDKFLSCTGIPPGFRFQPMDTELILHYLSKHATTAPCPGAPIITEVDIYAFEPWELPQKATFGEREWYFFWHRERKHLIRGLRTIRTTRSGYWKVTDRDKMITLSPADDKIVGYRKTLVFYKGRAHRGEKTGWVMHEYRLADDSTKASSSTSSTLKKWFLCRIFTKNTEQLQTSPSTTNHILPLQQDGSVSTIDDLSFNATESSPECPHLCRNY